MGKYETPKKPGYYWGKLVHPSQMPLNEDWVSRQYEIVEVVVNCVDPDDDDYLRVSVPGIGPSQDLDGFVWGPKVQDWRP